MRLVIDMQGAQSLGSRNRGVGRYTTSFVKALCEQQCGDEVILALNGLFADTIDVIRAEFASLLPYQNIRVWTGPAPCHAADRANTARRQAAEKMREAFLASLKPDVVLVTSLFEGYGDNAITSIGEFTSTLPTAVVLYDLIPLIHQDIYLSNPGFKRWYLNKIDQLRRADLLLSISSSSEMEGREYLCFPESSVVNVSTACDAHFKPVPVSAARVAELERFYGLTKPFVMYTGGIDHRKNIEGLIRAYAALPLQIRKRHQLAVVCSVREPERLRLEELAAKSGLQAGEMLMTGFVPEADLLALYNLCKLFVFPSWHEGFGLPALEAMACGRAVIGSNTSSVPEVIGREDALFDPRSDEAITAKILEVLSDEDLRGGLAAHGLKQAARFSWTDSASRAWEALRGQPKKTNAVPQPFHRPRLAYVSPIPSAHSGIADYSAELLPELARHYRIDVIVCQDEPLTDAWIEANCTLRTPEWFRRHSDQYERVVYHFGNSHFHGHMFSLLKEIPGVVVLHDFFLSGIVAHRDALGEIPGGWARSLASGHGWNSVAFRYSVKDTADAVWAYPCNLDVLQQAVGIIVHSENSRLLADRWYGEGSGQSWHHIPLLRMPAGELDRAKARQNLGIHNEDFVICSFGLLGKTKLNHRLLQAWIASPMAHDPNCRLVFVGQNASGEYGAEILRTSRGTPARVEITGWVDTDTYRQWLTAGDGAVQLRTLSRGETSAAVLDCMNYGLATIVNAHGAMADLSDDVVCKLPDEFSDEELIDALTYLWRDPEGRRGLGMRARERILAEHNPRRCGDLYEAAIESCYREADRSVFGLLNALRRPSTGLSRSDSLGVAQSLSRNFAPAPRRPQMLVDISELVQRDSKSGIQRVVRALLLELLSNPPAGWQVEPVYGTTREQGYRYARRYTCNLMQIPATWATDDFVETYHGDVFLALDLQPQVIPAQRQVLEEWRRQGCKVYAVIYDLLPLFLPEKFVQGAAEGHQRWLESIAQFDGALAISRAVADELNLWLDAFGSEKRTLPFDIHYFHLGADIEQSIPSAGMPEEAGEVFAALAKRHTFLMVGTVEGRKGYAQVLAAFEELWRGGLEVNLVIVGKQGWLVEKLVEAMRSHEELNNKLFWLEGISDEYLAKVYAKSSCLIAASEGEGFGLPLIEAARHKLPIIARDIPVFREVAEEHACYFDNNNSPLVLADAIRYWLGLYHSGEHPRSDSMHWLTWKESAEQAVQALLGGVPYKSWLPDGILRYWGNDPRLYTQVGIRQGRSIVTTGKAGFLIYGPYASLVAGRYCLEIQGYSKVGEENCWLDVSCDSGSVQLLKMGVPAADHEGNWAVSAELLLDHRVSDLEIRLWVSADADLRVHGISISPMEASEPGLQESPAEECSEVVEAA